MVDDPAGRLGRVASGAAGAALTVIFGAMARVRPTDKPLHPRGAQFSGVLDRWGLQRRRGVGWLDEPGQDRVLVRFSRAIGLPGAVPDVLGLTVRVYAPGGHADLLLATTGTGHGTRFALLPRRKAATVYGSLLPYRAPAGPLLFLARCGEGEPYPSTITLCVAAPRGEWEPFGRIDLDTREQPRDPIISFDPLLNVLPGLQIYPWVRRLREGAYATSRRARGDPGT